MVPYLRAGNVRDGSLDLDDVKEMSFTPAEQSLFSLKPRDVLVTEGSGSLRSVGASAVWRGEIAGTVCFQNTLLRLRPRSSTTDPRFLAWWCRHAFADGLFASVATGANIHHISAQRVRSLATRTPHLYEQRAIADFLDTETARIDALIAKKRRMIVLLKERFVRVVFDGVTGRLTSPSEPQRDSGLDWLGPIPGHWGVAPVGANFEVQLGKMLNPKASGGPDQYPYLRNTNVQWDHIELDEVATMHFDVHERAVYQLRPGDLLVCEGGEVGRAAIWDGTMKPMLIQKALHRVRPRGSADARYLMYCLRAAADQKVFGVEGNQATIVHLTAEKLRMHRFPTPPLEEQRNIVRRLDMAKTHMTSARSLLERQIELLHEHRRALITAAVTGEMEVAGVGA